MQMQTKKSACVAVKNKLFNCKYSLTLWQEKLLKGILFLVQKENQNAYEYTIRVDKSELKKLMFGNSRPNDGRMFAVFKNLMSRVVKLKSRDGDFILTHWVQTLTYEEKTNQVVVEFEPKLIPILTQYGNFTLLDTNVVFGAKCVWTERLYPLLRQYKDFGHRELMWSDIKDSWELSKSYQTMGNFIKWVLKPAVEEINLLSDIRVSYNYIYAGRFISGFRFTIREKPQATVTIETTAKEGVKNSIIKAILKWTDDDVVEWKTILPLQQEDESTEQFEERLKDALDYCKSYKSPIKNKGAFLYSAILKTYRKNGVVPDMFTDIQEEVRQEQEKKMAICGNCEQPEIENQKGEDFLCNRKGKVYNYQIAKWVQCPFFE